MQTYLAGQHILYLFLRNLRCIGRPTLGGGVCLTCCWPTYGDGACLATFWRISSYLFSSLSALCTARLASVVSERKSAAALVLTSPAEAGQGLGWLAWSLSAGLPRRLLTSGQQHSCRHSCVWEGEGKEWIPCYYLRITRDLALLIVFFLPNYGQQLGWRDSARTLDCTAFGHKISICMINLTLASKTKLLPSINQLNINH